MSDAYLNLIKAAKQARPFIDHASIKGDLIAAIEAAEKELEASQRTASLDEVRTMCRMDDEDVLHNYRRQEAERNRW